MSKKIIITLGILVLIIMAGSAYFLYRPDFLNPLTSEKLLAGPLVIKNVSLTPEAIALFQQRFDETKAKLQADPSGFNDWLYLGVLKKGAGDYEGSRDIFIYAGQLRPQSSTPFANLADVYAYFLNDPFKAEESMKKAIANDPSDYNLYLALADIYRYKFFGGAVKYEQTMLEAIGKFPDNVNLIASLAAYFRDTNQTLKAIKWYKELLRVSPDNAEAKKDLAELEAKQ